MPCSFDSCSVHSATQGDSRKISNPTISVLTPAACLSTAKELAVWQALSFFCLEVREPRWERAAKAPVESGVLLLRLRGPAEPVRWLVVARRGLVLELAVVLGLDVG